MKTKKFRFITVISALFTILLLLGVFYVNDYYHSEESVTKYLQANGRVTVSETEDGIFLDGSGEENAVIFYPGAKVEYTAYLPLFSQLAEQGVDCFLLKMPCNLAFLGQNKADEVMNDYDYPHWYLAGHSLGGAMAASWAADHAEKLDGLILLAAYPTKDMSEASLSVLSVYGSKDGVLKMEKVEEGRQMMPEAYRELCIQGGNHAGFGNYGKQKGDGEADISQEEQQEETVAAILEMLGK